MNTTSKRQGMAITSLVLGILSMVCFGFLTGIPAIILGHIAHRRTRKAPEQYAGSGLAIAGFVMGYASLLTTLIVVMLAAKLLPALGRAKLPALAQAKAEAQSVQCVNNMKQIGLAFRVWALDNKDRFPFNVSTNEGGTMELRAEGKDGFDLNPAQIFQVLSNELSTPKILVCPADPSKQPALDFRTLQADNVTYQARSGTNVNDTHPQEVLVRCPIHGTEGFCDGSVQQGRRQ
jgi:hypothetical protein